MNAVGIDVSKGKSIGGRALPPGLFGASSETGPFAWELLRSPSASPERSLPKQNYFFISKIENYRKSFIHADLPLFCTFPKFFPKSKIGRQILPLLESDRNSHPKTSRINQSESDRNSQS